MEVKANQWKQMPKQASHEDGEPLTKRYLSKTAEKLDKQLVKNCPVFNRFSVSKTAEKLGQHVKVKNCRKTAGQFLTGTKTLINLS